MPNRVDYRDAMSGSILRLSVTDRCDLRCAYCMPGESYTWLPRRDLLSFDEIERLVDIFCGLGECQGAR